MGPRRTGGHDHPVEPFFPNHRRHLVLGVLAAGEQVFLHILNPGQGPGIGGHLGHAHDSTDVDAAVAHEDADARGFTADIPLGRDFHGPGQGVACIGQVFCGGTGGGTGFHHRLGDILGSGGDPAGIYSRH